ncbi:ribonuclease E inhibitor RraB [Demequina sp. NBRC 110056]|uniref:ribonuclease E inhibitor RraB n=1 Tax=Demequina sp. NBRC 110056 TaxID=1570345 RepID=UPI000A04ED8B|nr:ribonuclease E inhibitor RraB [Demequina sp. NBRC 110056]
MGLFSKLTAGKRKRVDPYGLWSDDAEQLQTFLDRGASIDAPRDSEFSVSFTKEDAARAAGKELGELKVRGELVAPSHGVDEWSVLIYGREQPLVPDFLRETIDLAERIAATHGGEYEGWIAKYTADEKAAWGVELLFDD